MNDNQDLESLNSNHKVEGDKDFLLMNYYLKPYLKLNKLPQGYCIQNPFVKETQKTPSFNIFYNRKSGKWKYKDFATDDFGDVYDLVKRLFGLNFQQAKAKIRDDLLMISNMDATPIQQISTIKKNNEADVPHNLKKQTMEEDIKKNKNDMINPREFIDADKDFWYTRFEIKREILIKYKVIPISWFTNKGRKIFPQNITYAYDIGDGYKIYQPLNTKFKFMYVSKKAEKFIFGYEQLPASGDVIFITGGEKDVLTLASKDLNAITLNSETATLPDWLYEDLKSRFKNIIILYDNDSTGKENSNLLCQKFGFSRINLPKINTGKDVSDYVSLGHSLPSLLRLQLPHIFNQPFAISSFSDLAVNGNELASIKKIWGCYILENSITLFPAERGIGKSFLAMQLSMCIADEEDSFCNEVLELHGNVIYLNLELSEFLFSKRITKLRESKAKKGRYDVYCLTFNGNFNQYKLQIAAAIKEHKPVLIIIDNLRAASSHLDNEKNKVMVDFIQDLIKISREHNCAFVIVHHLKKGTQNQLVNSDMQSGAGALTDLADADFFLVRSSNHEDYRLLKRIKSRSCEEQKGVKVLKFNRESLWFEFIEESADESEHISIPDKYEDRKQDTDEMKILHAQGATLEEIAKVFGVNKSTVSRRLKH